MMFFLIFKSLFIIFLLFFFSITLRIVLEKSGQDHLNAKERSWVDRSNNRGKFGKKRGGNKSRPRSKKKRRQ